MQKLSRQLLSIGAVSSNKLVATHQGLLRSGSMLKQQNQAILKMNGILLGNHHEAQRLFSTGMTRRNNFGEANTVGSTITTSSQQAPNVSSTTATTPQKPTAFEEPLHEQQSFNLDDFEDEVAGQQLEAAETMSSLFSSFTDYVNPSNLLEACIVTLHDAGCPWWGSIAIVGFALRLVMSPLNVLSMRTSTIMSKLGTSLTNLKKEQVDPKKTPQEREHARKKYDEIAKKEGFKMSHMFLPLIQSPIFIAFFFCLNRMAREVSLCVKKSYLRN